MMIQHAPQDMSEPKTLKVSLPPELYLKLHQLKLLTGRNISETVQEAVEAHIAGLKRSEETDGGEAA